MEAMQNIMARLSNSGKGETVRELLGRCVCICI